MKIKALIPVRSGSLRVANKNIRPFANSTLLEIKIKQMLSISSLDGVVVNSNDDTMLKIAEKAGAETVKRDQYFATNEVSINEVYCNMAENFSADIMLFVHVTNPLLSNETIKNALNKYKNLAEHDSINTVHDVKEFLWKDGVPINYDPTNKPRSQDLPNIITINHAVNIIDKNLAIKNKDIFGTKPFLLPIDKVEAIDIDDMLDFEFAEFMYKKYRLN